MFQTIVDLLEQKIGLSAHTVGLETVIKAIEHRMVNNGLTDPQNYLNYLQSSDEEWQALIESVVVLETWFFRNQESFTFLGRYVRLEWLPTHQDSLLRVLSIPCATGEEPYSIAMTLMDAGLPANRFHIEAVDISHFALQKAKQGIYGLESFRGQQAKLFQQHYFEKQAEGYYVSPSVKRTVHFKSGNVLEKQFLKGEKHYDVIFCRNLLIYLDNPAKYQVIKNLDRLLASNGILFVGHAERPAVCESGFVQISEPGVFACLKVKHFEKIKNQQTITTLKNTIRTSTDKNLINPQNLILKPEKRSLIPNHNELAKLEPEKSNLLKKETFSVQTGNKKKLLNHTNPSVTDEDLEEKESPLVESVSTELSDKTSLLETAQQMADQGYLKDALKLCEQCLTEKADHIQAHFLMGLIYQALDSDKKAEACFNKTIYLDPNHFEALNHLAVIMEYRGEIDKALHFRRRMQRIRQRENPS